MIIMISRFIIIIISIMIIFMFTIIIKDFESEQMLCSQSREELENCTAALAAALAAAPIQVVQQDGDLVAVLRGNHLSNTACLTRFLQKRRIMQQIQVAVLDKQCHVNQVRPH